MHMETTTTVWIVVAVIAVLILVAILGVMMSRKKQEQNRTRAGELREQAAAQTTGVQQREAGARETEAQARQAQAEADQKAAQAERLEAHASDKHSTAATYREDRDDNLRRADEVDPDTSNRDRGAKGHPNGADGSDTHTDPGSHRG
jgi:uncharacterized protein HemX